MSSLKLNGENAKPDICPVWPLSTAMVFPVCKCQTFIIFFRVPPAINELSKDIDIKITGLPAPLKVWINLQDFKHQHLIKASSEAVNNLVCVLSNSQCKTCDMCPSNRLWIFRVDNFWSIFAEVILAFWIDFN